MKKKPTAPSIPSRKKIKHKTGMPPGSIVYTGDKHAEKSALRLVQYSDEQLIVTESANFSEIIPHLKNVFKVNWLNISGLSNESLLEEIGKYFNLHPLTIEDIANIDHRPMFADYGTHLFLTLEMLRYNSDASILEDDHLCLVLFENTVLSFQEVPNDALLMISDRLHNDIGKLRVKESDYLFYTLIDIMVDHYYLVVEAIGNQIDALEEKIYEHAGQYIEQSIQVNKRNLIQLRKLISPLRDELGRLLRSDSELMHPKTMKYISDVYEHCVQVAEAIDTNREINNGLMDVYDSIVNRRMNQIMKLLTVISTLFIPLTFIVGVYGMNFENLPETRWYYGYYAVWGVMIAIVIGLLVFFKRKQWLD